MSKFKFSSVFLGFCALLFTLGCSSNDFDLIDHIARDPSWTGISTYGKEDNLRGFSTDLLQEMNAKCKTNLTVINVAPDQVISGLNGHKYEAVMSNLTPSLKNQDRYYFSDVWFSLGPVLVVPVSSDIDSVDKLGNKIVGFEASDNAYLLLEKNPTTLIKSYQSIPQALQDLSQGKLDAVALSPIVAYGYCNNLYNGVLKVSTPSLTPNGIRVVSLKSNQDDLIQKFNKGLKALQEDGTYERLLKKWDLL